MHMSRPQNARLTSGPEDVPGASDSQQTVGAVAMRTRTLQFTALVLALVVLGGCSFGLFSKKRKTDVEIVVLFTGNTNGELAPCG